MPTRQDAVQTASVTEPGVVSYLWMSPWGLSHRQGTTSCVVGNIVSSRRPRRRAGDVSGPG